MAFRPNTRRVFTSWQRAAVVARGWGWQTGWKHRITKIRGGYRATRTDRRSCPVVYPHRRSCTCYDRPPRSVVPTV